MCKHWERSCKSLSFKFLSREKNAFYNIYQDPAVSSLTAPGTGSHGFTGILSLLWSYYLSSTFPSSSAITYLLSPAMYSSACIKCRRETEKAGRIAVRGWMNSGSYHFLWWAEISGHEIEQMSWMIPWIYSQLCFSSEIQRLRSGDYMFSFQLKILEMETLLEAKNYAY